MDRNNKLLYCILGSVVLALLNNSIFDGAKFRLFNAGILVGCLIIVLSNYIIAYQWFAIFFWLQYYLILKIYVALHYENWWVVLTKYVIVNIKINYIKNGAIHEEIKHIIVEDYNPEWKNELLTQK